MSLLLKHSTVYKHIGETPLQALERFRTEKNIPENVSLTYAGRLDPMAEGLLLILIGEECKRQDLYHSLDKRYEFEILFGVSSDTGDILGLTETCTVPAITLDAIKRALRKLKGTITLPYPRFSSKTVNGKPLHVWALEKRLDEIEIPVRTSKIYTLELIKLGTVPAHNAFEYIEKKISSIPTVTEPSKELGADFRKNDVRAGWEKIKREGKFKDFIVATCICDVSSGTYMRSLASLIAKELGTCGLAYSIKRSRIGEYLPLPFGTGMWIKRY